MNNKPTKPAPVADYRQVRVCVFGGIGMSILACKNWVSQIFITAAFTALIVFLTATTSMAIGWTGVNSNNLAVSGHTATLLSSGKVIVVGGLSGSSPAKNIQLYDPVNNSWSFLADSIYEHWNHSATLLSNGKLLIVGGPSAEAELYDPVVNTWSSAGSSTGGSDAALLPNGNLMITGVGGYSVCHFYNPTLNVWSLAPSMSVDRRGHTINILNDGRILVVGGFSPYGQNDLLSSAEIYNLDTNAWSAIASMSVPRVNHRTALLSNGKLLVIGGYVGDIVGSTNTVEIYDPIANTWSTASSLITGRESFTANILPNGKVIVTGGWNPPNHLSSAEIYDPITNLWSPAGSISISRASHTATKLADGKIFVTGGNNNSGYILSSTIYDSGYVPPPTITLTSIPLRYSNKAADKIEFTANETATFQCKLDSGAYAPCTSPFNYNNLANGQHTFSIQATDGAGNVSAPVTHTWTVNTALAASSAILLPQTGQTKCYDAAGAELASCDGTGQDGDFRAGVPWPNPRFTDNGNGTVSDNLTGLQWTKDANLMVSRDPTFDADGIAQDGKVSWYHALDYVKKLNTENYLGHNDWRLPNRNELVSLLNNGQENPATWYNSMGFFNVYDNYWPSSTVIRDSGGVTYVSSAWIVETHGYVDFQGNKFSDYFYVWPVRSGQPDTSGSITLSNTGQTTCYNESLNTVSCGSTGQDGESQAGVAWPNTRFVDHKIEAASDNLTGLIWIKDANMMKTRDPLFDQDLLYGTSNDGKVTWQHAMDYVDKLNTENYLGYNDWRLPNRNELESLLNNGVSNTATWLNSLGFTNVPSAFWSGSTSASLTKSSAWYLDAVMSMIGWYAKIDLLNVWPVRGGYIAPRLTVTKAGSGNISASTGTLTWNASVATAYYGMGDNTVVTLSATPGTNLSTTWTGCDSFTGNSCTVTMNMKKNVTATFADITPPAPPSNIYTDAPTVKGQITVTWTNPTDADFSHIHIYRSTVTGTLGTLIGDNVTGIKYTDTGLASLTPYYYTVRSVDATGNESTNTTQVSATTLDATPPPLPTGVTAVDTATGGSVQVTWIKPNVSDYAFARVYYSTSVIDANPAVSANITGNTVTITGLTNGTQYFFVVRTVDTSGNETTNTLAHNIKTATPTTPDTTPPGEIGCGSVTITDTTKGGELNLTWTNPVADFAKLKVYRSTAATVEGTLQYEGTGNTLEQTGLTSGTSYYYSFRTVDQYNNQVTTPLVVGTNQCSAIPTDTVAPLCPTGLTASVVNDTIQLNWTRSGSPDINRYQLYSVNSDGTLAANLATVNQNSQTTFTWTSATLTPGSTYRYTLQAEDNVTPTPNTNSTCGIVTATIPPPAPLCSVSASIKNPHTGKKLGGNSVNVMAEVTGSENNVGSILFQYRESNTAPWLSIPPRLAQFPNPDTAKPWFVLWDISTLPDKDYDIRALVTCKDNAQPDPAPGFITVTIDQAKSEESCNDGNVTTGVHLIAPFSTVKGDSDTKGTTKLTLPDNCLDEDTTVVITDNHAITPPAGHQGCGVYRDINFGNSQHTLANGKKADLEISYKDDDDDGIVDGTTINVHDLQICDYDGTNWTCLDSVVDTVNKKVKCKTSTFSTFGLLVPPKPLAAGWNLVAVPLTPNPATPVSLFGSGAYFWNPTTAAYVNPSIIEPGKAYWVRGGTAINATGTETPDAPFSIPILKGWNLIGNPFRYKVNVNALTVTNGSTKTILQAETAGWVVGTLFSYTGGSYLMSTAQDGGTMAPWKGYWILSDINGTLTVPNTPAQ